MALLFVACGEGDEGESNGEADSIETVGDDIEDATELTLWTFAPNHVDFYVDAAERWNEDHSDQPIKLKAETYRADQMHNNLLLADRKSTRLDSSHVAISYPVFCLKKKKSQNTS